MKNIVFYTDYDYKIILDRPDLIFSPYIGALDIQYAHYAPYLWTFTIDSTGVVAYGRTFDDLKKFFDTLKIAMNLSNESNRKHFLKIIVEDLFYFFGNTKKVFDYDPLPFVARSASDVLLCSFSGVYQLHSYKAYYETNLIDDMLNNHGILTPNIDTDKLSANCSLTDEEIENSANRVIYMSVIFRQEVDFKYQGNIATLPLTKTARVGRLIAAEQRKQINESRCNIKSQTMKANPLASEWGREFLLPLLYKSFFGGINFFELNIPDKVFCDVTSADISSAYIARMVLSRFPIGKFFEMQKPDSYKKLFKPPFSSFAMLITFTAEVVEINNNGLAFLPAQMRHRYIDIHDKNEIADHVKNATNTRIRSVEILRMTLTDIDFKLFCENYHFKRIRIENIVASKYGFLPDYIQNIVTKLYSDKAKAKKKKEALEKVGDISLSDKIEYDAIKNLPARLYGLFTKKPIVEKYEFSPEKKDAVITDNYYIPPNQKYSPVLYQWGVWTTALARKEITAIRRALIDAPNERQIKVLSGDTDNINFTGNAIDIISNYNDHVKAQINKREKALGLEPGTLEGLGELTIKKYKKFKLTGMKQYCFIRESKSGDVFEYRVGGMSAACNYFDINFNTPDQKLNHFGLGLTIPAEYSPRVVSLPISERVESKWIDRDGNMCESFADSYVSTIRSRFTLFPSLLPSPLGNTIKPGGQKITKNEVALLSRKISNPVYNPLNYIKNK